MTTNKAKKISLEVWRYLAEHPEIDSKKYLPKKLFAKIKNCVLECPLCSIFFFSYTCSNCPLRSCSSDNSLFLKWNRSLKPERRKFYAQKIVRRIESWDPGKA